MIEYERKEKYDINDYREIIRILRQPGGCPWDIAQTHESIRRNLIEEAYEAAVAIDNGDLENLKEELGDVLMQVLTHAQMEEDAGGFTIDDVTDMSCKKLIFRHPHVFGDAKADTPDEVLKTWDEVKKIEKSQKSTTDTLVAVAEGLPALWRAEKIQKKAHKVGFDFENVSDSMKKLEEERAELSQAISQNDRENITEEIGDVLFATANVARMLGIDPEQALHKSCEKFIDRFAYVENAATQMGQKLENMSIGQMEELYQAAKSEKSSKNPKNA